MTDTRSKTKAQTIAKHRVKVKASPLSTFVRARREQLKLTQPNLARRAGVGLRFIRELEAGKPTLRCDKVNQVLALFGKELGPIDSVRED